jgi:hypothetical protein
MIVVNLQHCGLVPHKFCHKEELAVVLGVAEEILADEPDAETMDQIVTEWETALIWDSMTQRGVSSEWYYRALLLTCVQGLRGKITPQFYFLGDDS